jgi:phosphoribosylamine---glycine ligase
VVMAANGYPGTPEKGTAIKNLAKAEAMANVMIFHAGTKLDGDTLLDGETLLANGGRVLNVTAVGSSVRAAQAKAYQAVDAIDWPGGFCRRDIGSKAVARES